MVRRFGGSLLVEWVCPKCRNSLEFKNEKFICNHCEKEYDVTEENGFVIPHFAQIHDFQE